MGKGVATCMQFFPDVISFWEVKIFTLEGVKSVTRLVF